MYNQIPEYIYGEVADTIIRYSKQGEIISTKGLHALTKDLAYKMFIRKYARELKINGYTKTMRNLSLYDSRRCKINLNYSKIKSLQPEEDMFSKEFTEYDKVLYKNIILVGQIVKELEHASQKALVFDKKDDAESLMTNIVNRASEVGRFDKTYDIDKKQKKLDNDKHLRIKPTERMAIVEKNKFMQKVLNYMDISDNLRLHMSHKAFKENFTYYNNFESPSKKYLEKLENLEDKFDKDYYKKNIEKLKSMKLDLLTKFKLGLEISEKEKMQLIQENLMNNSKIKRK